MIEAAGLACRSARGTLIGQFVLRYESEYFAESPWTMSDAGRRGPASSDDPSTSGDRSALIR